MKARMKRARKTRLGTILGVVAWLAVCLLVWAPVAMAQEAAEVDETPSRPAADPADVGSIDAIMAAVYDVISGEAGEERDWDRFLSLFVPEGRLLPSGTNPQGEHEYRVWSAEEYVERAQGFFADSGFYEIESHRVVEEFGGIAHVFSTYESRHAADELEPFQRGINSFQLMNDGSRWYVVSIFWQAESLGSPIPEKYLP